MKTIAWNKLTFALAALLLMPSAVLHATGLANLRCEYRTNPLGIDETQPQLSWVIESDRRGEWQTASGFGGIVAGTAWQGSRRFVG